MTKYDPDRITEANFDYEDMELIDGYLEHPNTVAITEELGRQFRNLAPSEQIPEIERWAFANRERLRTLESALARDQRESDPRVLIAERIRAAINAAEPRLGQLRSELG